MNSLSILSSRVIGSNASKRSGQERRRTRSDGHLSATGAKEDSLRRSCSQQSLYTAPPATDSDENEEKEVPIATGRCRWPWVATICLFLRALLGVLVDFLSWLIPSPLRPGSTKDTPWRVLRKFYAEPKRAKLARSRTPPTEVGQLHRVRRRATLSGSEAEVQDSVARPPPSGQASEKEPRAARRSIRLRLSRGLTIDSETDDLAGRPKSGTNTQATAPSPPRPLIPSRKLLVPVDAKQNAHFARKTLVLDLDETLIHSLAKGGKMSSGHMVEVKLSGAATYGANTIGPQHPILYYVHKRPHCDEFLRHVCKWYELVVFTASVQEYADPVIDWLEQERKFFSARFYRQHCTFRNGAYIKDLGSLEPDLRRIMILDNSPLSYVFHEDNAIPIEGWINDPTDNDLLHLIPMLEGLQYVSDVRALLALRRGETDIQRLN